MARAWVFGDDISTDDIIAGRYLSKFEAEHDPRWLADHVMENVDPEFASKVKEGDVIIGGKNFGCGSSREEAPIALKGAGIKAVFAESFARIFYRNSINRGLYVFVSPGVSRGFKSGDEVEVDVEKGEILNVRTGETFRAEPMPEFMLKIIRVGGLLEHLKGRK
ncbi:MAG: 3-isopropylmalate dehydratase small subunit [Hadesarchaea archaeon]|nr:3-isopropylmalate dehydratase small subunit [Hadesarchaea archaeon]